MTKGTSPSQFGVLSAPLANESGARGVSRGRPLIMIALVLGGWTTIERV